MTDELRSLLRRVHAAGGPVEVNASGEVVFAQLGPRCEVTLDLEAGSREQPRNDALLIHALKLDAQQRDARLATDWILDNDRWMCGVSTMRNYGGGQSSESTMSLHEDEATAHCLAWLDAFEDKP